jgi:hypothetical protein
MKAAIKEAVKGHEVQLNGLVDPTGEIEGWLKAVGAKLKA